MHVDVDPNRKYVEPVTSMILIFLHRTHNSSSNEIKITSRLHNSNNFEFTSDKQ